MRKDLILDDFLPYRLAILSHSVSHSIATVYDDRFDISIPEWRVIAIVGRFPGLSAADVAERTVMDKVAVSRAVTKLIRNGRIDRQFADADRRRSILNLSTKGRELHNEIAPFALRMEADLLADLTEAEIEMLDVVIDKLYAKAQSLTAPDQPTES